MTNRRALSSAVLLAAMLAAPAAARDAEEPIKLAYLEGDLGGFSNILDKDGKEIIGVVTYTQQRKGDTLEAKRVAWFKDGSSDEDTTVAKVGKTLRTLRGQSIIRDPSGETIVSMLPGPSKWRSASPRPMMMPSAVSKPSREGGESIAF